MAKIKLTQAGYDKLQQELELYKKVKRPQVISRIAAARELGDLAENSDYDDAREQQSFIEGRILDLENKLKNCEIISKTQSNGQVSLGSLVTVKTNGSVARYEIVGESEADPIHSKISDKSPIGKALIDAKPGERVLVTTPQGKKTYTVLKIE